MPSEQFSSGQLSGEQFSSGQLSGEQLSSDQLSQWPIVLLGNCRMSNCPVSYCLSDQLSTLKVGRDYSEHLSSEHLTSGVLSDIVLSVVVITTMFYPNNNGVVLINRK